MRTFFRWWVRLMFRVPPLLLSASLAVCVLVSGETQLIRGVHDPVLRVSTILLNPALAGKKDEETTKKKKEITHKNIDIAPRSVEDIVALLEASPDTRSEGIKRALEIALMEPSEKIRSNKGKKAAFFYHQRLLARREVGMVGGELEDARRVLELSKDADMLRDSGMTEQYVGNWKTAHEIFELSVSLAKNKRYHYSSLSRSYAFTGDIEKAEIYRKKTATAYSQSSSPWGRYHSAITAMAISYTEGRWQDAEEELQMAISAMNSDGSYAADVYEWKAFLVGLQINAGKLNEAELSARKGLRAALEYYGTKANLSVGEFVSSLAVVMMARGRFDDALKLIDEGKSIYTNAGLAISSSRFNKFNFLSALVSFYKHNFVDSVKQFDELAKNLKENPLVYEQLYRSNSQRLMAYVLAGRSETVLPEIEIAFAEQVERMGKNHRHTALVQATRASALADLGKDKQALSDYRESIPRILQRSLGGGVATDTVGDQIFQRMILEQYLALLARMEDTGETFEDDFDPLSESFQIAGQARLGSVARALAASSARAATRDPELSKLARAEQDSIHQIKALYAKISELTSAPENQVDREVISTLRERIDALRKSRSQIIETIEKKSPEYADLINPKPATLEQAQSILLDNESLITTYVGQDKMYLWAIPSHGEPRFATIKIEKDYLVSTVNGLRSSLDPQAESLGDIPEFDLDIAFELYQSVLEPVKSGWENARSLLVIAHGPLGYLPFSLLPTESGALPEDQAPLFSNYRNVPWMAREYAITTLPSVTSLINLRNLPATESVKNFIGFGDPWFSLEQADAALEEIAESQVAISSRGLPVVRAAPVTLRAVPRTRAVDSAQIGLLPRLPDTAKEIESIAHALNSDPGESLFIGKAASEEMVKDMDLSGTSVIAFATHGLIPGDLDGLDQPALALSSPKVTGGEGDGLLTAGEVLGLKLDADWVVLSACNTAAGDGAGAEAISGLGRAFFYAGTRSLLVSNWPVESTSARALTTSVFKNQSSNPEMNRSTALQLAMLEMIDNGGYKDPDGNLIFSYAHPIFWAPFTLVGDGGS